MKKQHFIFIVLFLFLFGITGCGKKAISSDGMASLFINKFIYDKETTDFEENFVDGDILGKQLGMMTDNFETTFADAFDSITEKLTNEEKERIASDLMAKMKKESQYTVSIKKESKNKVKVTYTINGLDYAKLVELTLKDILSKLTNDAPISEDAIPKELVNSFETSLNDVKSVKESQKVTLMFEKSKRKWEISEDQDDKLEQILLSFVTGQKDKQVYEKKMEDVIQSVIKEVSE